jgi:Tfp pilus assembly protein PilN
MRYSINLTTRPYLDHRTLNRCAAATIALLVIIVGWNISRVASNSGEQSRLNAEIAAIQGRLSIKPSGISEAQLNSQKSKIRFYNDIIERKSTNWLYQLDLFEQVTPEGIFLSSLSQDKNKGEWRLEGYARSFKNIQKYLEKLETSKNFATVLLLSHQNMTAGIKTHGVQFVISCKVVQ